MLSGSTEEIAETIRGYRETYGFTYITVQQRHAEPVAKYRRTPLQGGARCATRVRQFLAVACDQDRHGCGVLGGSLW